MAYTTTRMLKAALAARGVLEEAVDPAAGSDAASARWVHLDNAGDLAFDHDEILADALRLAR